MEASLTFVVSHPLGERYELLCIQVVFGDRDGLSRHVCDPKRFGMEGAAGGKMWFPRCGNVTSKCTRQYNEEHCVEVE